MSIALPQLYKFVAFNETGQVIAINGVTVTIRQQKFDSSGVPVEGAEVTLQNAGTIANATEANVGAEQDNTVNKYLGGYGKAEVTAPVSSIGNVSIYLMASTANPSSYPTERDVPVAVLNFTAAATKSVNFTFQ